MNAIKNAMENYVDWLHNFSDPFNVGMSVHLTLLFVNWFAIFIIIRLLTKNKRSALGRMIHELGGFISFVLGYLLTVLFIWIKNN